MPDATTGRTPAYSITEVLEVLDPAGAERYAELTLAAVEKFGGRIRVRPGPPDRRDRHAPPAGLPARYRPDGLTSSAPATEKES